MCPSVEPHVRADQRLAHPLGHVFRGDVLRQWHARRSRPVCGDLHTRGSERPPLSTAGPTYHLWLKPAGPTYDLLARAICELARDLGAPVFAPHVTLLAHLEGSEGDHRRRTEQLAGKLRPFPIVLTDASHGETYFQCVFLRVQESPALTNAHARARRVFGAPNRTYMPHLSLVYGDYPAVRKQAIIARVRAELRTSFDASAVYLIKAESEDPKDWHDVARAPFTA